MAWAETALVVLLRMTGLLLLLAVGAAVMPFAWMAATHRWLGLGELPDGPTIGYLTRSLSALYALHGALLLYVSLDVLRYLPLIRCLAVLGIAFGAGMIVLDSAVGLPYWWIVGEGPPIVVLSVALLWLAARADREAGKAES